MKLMNIINRLFGRNKAELVNTTPTASVEDCPSELFNSMLVATHIAREDGLNVRFLTFTESGMDVPLGFHVYDWAEKMAFGLSLRDGQDDGGVIVCHADEKAWLIGFIRGFRQASGVPPVVHTEDVDFFNRIAN